MHPLLRVLALLVLALWWPATVHCQIEAALALQSPHCHAEDDCTPSASDGQHSHDSCGLIEDIGYKAAATTLLVAAPALAIADVSAAPLPRLGDSFAPGLSAGMDDSAVTWVPAWTFERRAAGSPRAPSKR